jgi:LysM repeat protein
LLSIGQKLLVPNVKKASYKVVSGDTLYSIAQKFGTTVNKLKEINNLKSNDLTIGQILVVN